MLRLQEKKFWQPHFLRAISKNIFHFLLLLLCKYFFNPCGLKRFIEGDKVNHF